MTLETFCLRVKIALSVNFENYSTRSAKLLFRERHLYGKQTNRVKWVFRLRARVVRRRVGVRKIGRRFRQIASINFSHAILRRRRKDTRRTSCRVNCFFKKAIINLCSRVVFAFCFERNNFVSPARKVKNYDIGAAPLLRWFLITTTIELFARSRVVQHYKRRKNVSWIEYLVSITCEKKKNWNINYCDARQNLLLLYRVAHLLRGDRDDASRWVIRPVRAREQVRRFIEIVPSRRDDRRNRTLEESIFHDDDVVCSGGTWHRLTLTRCLRSHGRNLIRLVHRSYTLRGDWVETWSIACFLARSRICFPTFFFVFCFFFTWNPQMYRIGLNVFARISFYIEF